MIVQAVLCLFCITGVNPVSDSCSSNIQHIFESTHKIQEGSLEDYIKKADTTRDVLWVTLAEGFNDTINFTLSDSTFSVVALTIPALGITNTTLMVKYKNQGQTFNLKAWLKTGQCFEEKLNLKYRHLYINKKTRDWKFTYTNNYYSFY